MGKDKEVFSEDKFFLMDNDGGKEFIKLNPSQVRFLNFLKEKMALWEEVEFIELSEENALKI